MIEESGSHGSHGLLLGVLRFLKESDKFRSSPCVETRSSLR